MSGGPERAKREADPPAAAPAAAPAHGTPATPTRSATPSALQRRLKVGRADDPLEREADRVATQVIRRLSADRQPSWAYGQQTTGRAVRRAATATPAAAVPSQPGVSRIARSIHRRADTARSGLDHGAASAAGGTVGSDVEQRISRARGGGAPLDSGTRRSMEDAFGADFGDVRLHQGSEPAALNDAVGAQAFTVGSDIFFGALAPDPATAAGQHLLAHELTHTVQQGGAVARTIRRVEVTEPNVVAPIDEVGGEPAEPAAPAGEGEPEQTMEGTIAEVTLPEEQTLTTGPPPGLEADATGKARGRSRGPVGRSRSTTAPQPASTTYAINVSSVGERSSLTHLSTMPGGGESDAVAAKVKASPKLSSGATVSPFGALNSAYSTTGVKWKSDKKAPAATINLGFTLNLRSQWGTSDAGRIDVASPTSSKITADNYQSAVADLTPGPNGGSWVAPRQQFWSQKICERHEKYHYNDVSGWFAKTGRQLVIDDLNTKSIAVATNDDEATIGEKVRQLVQGSIATITNAHIVYMNGTGLAYYDFPSEVRAFGDGKVPYETLAAGVKKHGEALTQKRDKAAKKSGK